MTASGSHDVYTWQKTIKVLGINVSNESGKVTEKDCIGIDFCPGSFSTITKAVDAPGIEFKTKGGLVTKKRGG